MKTITRNHYIQRINQVVNYINNHLNETIAVEKLAQTANLHHFISVAYSRPSRTSRLSPSWRVCV